MAQLDDLTAGLEAADGRLSALEAGGDDIPGTVLDDLKTLADSIEELQPEVEANCDALGANCFFLPPFLQSR